MCEVEEIILSNYDYLLNVAKKISSKNQRSFIGDLVQDTMVNAIIRKDHYYGSNIKNWLLTIMKNLYYDKHRHNKVIDNHLKYYKQVTNTRSINTGITALEDLNVTQFLIETLPSKHVSMFQMIIDDYSYNEISESLNIPLGTVKSRVSKARSILKDNIEKFEHNYKKENNLKLN